MRVLPNSFTVMKHPVNQFLLSLLAYTAQRGLTDQQIGELLNISVSDVVKSETPVMSMDELMRTWIRISQLTNDPLFGLHFGEAMQLSALGAVGEIIKFSHTVGEAVSHAAQMIPLVTNLFTMEVKKGKDSFTIKYKATDHGLQNETYSKQMMDFLATFTIHEMDGLLLKKVKPVSIYYPQRLTDSTEHERLLRGKVQYGKNLQIEFSNSYWNEPVITANYELQTLLLKKVTERSTQPAVSFKSKILDYLMANSYLGIQTLEKVSSNFNTTPRSIQRRLSEERTTFQSLSDTVKKTLAIHYMNSSSYQLKEISTMLGYNELSAFSRAFKRWTGKAPASYQAAQKR